MKSLLAVIIAAGAVLALVMFGLISLTTSLWTALGITIALVGLVVLVMGRHAPTVGFVLLSVGGFAYLMGDILPALTLGETLSMMGAP